MGVKKSGQNRGRGHRIVTPNKLDLTSQVSDHCVKFQENRIKIAGVGARTDTLTGGQTDASDLITCPMLFYVATGQMKMFKSFCKRLLELEFPPRPLHAQSAMQFGRTVLIVWCANCCRKPHHVGR